MPNESDGAQGRFAFEKGFVQMNGPHLGEAVSISKLRVALEGSQALQRSIGNRRRVRRFPLLSARKASLHDRTAGRTV